MKRQLLSMEEMDRISQQNFEATKIPRWVWSFVIAWVAFWATVGAIV